VTDSLVKALTAEKSNELMMDDYDANIIDRIIHFGERSLNGKETILSKYSGSIRQQEGKDGDRLHLRRYHRQTLDQQQNASD
jgi:hypothetical protein